MSGGEASPGHRSDRALWEDLRHGSEQAFAALFTRHGDAVYNFAFRRVACWATADDVTQATFLALWRRAREGRVEELRRDSARAVLLTMAGHECANAVRGRNRLAALVLRLPVESHQRDHAEQVDAEIDSERRMRSIRGLVDRLPAGQRAVVEMVWWSGCSLQDTADALGVPVGTVKSRLARARTRLGEAAKPVVREELA
ncbi:RNA polymerase sigma factor [Mumia sp. DW29H23]|uniref:RNA polymerase sigma factor n=1 Tax=Mumia sp. DW29H23 TaxID=3421241 RepID=UPI003D688300